MIGEGIYTLTEVARYTGIAPATARSWFKSRSDRKGPGPLFKSDYGPAGDDYAVSFLNLIEAYIARYFRFQGVKASRIRCVHRALQSELNSPHPFAREDLYTDGIDVFRRIGEETDVPEMIDVLTKPRQRVFGQWRDYLAQFDYIDSSGLASRWRIATGVVIDPKISFGKPVILSTGVTTYVLANQFNANHGNAALVADLFGVSEQDVLNAVQFETHPKAKRQAA